MVNMTSGTIKDWSFYHSAKSFMLDKVNGLTKDDIVITSGLADIPRLNLIPQPTLISNGNIFRITCTFLVLYGFDIVASSLSSFNRNVFVTHAGPVHVASVYENFLKNYKKKLQSSKAKILHQAHAYIAVQSRH
jgi:hypothetical protein